VSAAAPILSHLAAVSDPLRCRVLLLLATHELTVSELCTILQMPQSSVSRHLKTLGDDGWVISRRDGTSRFYSVPDDLDPAARQLWSLVGQQVARTPASEQDQRRLQGVLTGRRQKSQEFFASAAGQWDRLREGLFGDTFYLWAVLGLIDPTLVVGDLGCGTGLLTQAVAPHVAKVVAVDASAEMLEAARRRVDGAGNVELRRGELEALPIEDGHLDVAMLSLVLHHAADPSAALTEVARVVRPAGRALVVDMLPHDRDEYQQQMGHVWLGFSEKQIARLMSSAGFDAVQVRTLPVDPDAKGPALFAAIGTRT
jgi:ubiquinone/menaquinone biosynthesis C-methylase UbiE/DNA-binding transcriptional ArsR family regulator